MSGQGQNARAAALPASTNAGDTSEHETHISKPWHRPFIDNMPEVGPNDAPELGSVSGLGIDDSMMEEADNLSTSSAEYEDTESDIDLSTHISEGAVETSSLGDADRRLVQYYAQQENQSGAQPPVNNSPTNIMAESWSPSPAPPPSPRPAARDFTAPLVEPKPTGLRSKLNFPARGNLSPRGKLARAREDLLLNFMTQLSQPARQRLSAIIQTGSTRLRRKNNLFDVRREGLKTKLRLKVRDGRHGLSSEEEADMDEENNEHGYVEVQEEHSISEAERQVRMWLRKRDEGDGKNEAGTFNDLMSGGLVAGIAGTRSDACSNADSRDRGEEEDREDSMDIDDDDDGVSK